MIPHLFYYQLVVLGLLWFCVMRHHVWPSRCAMAPQRRAEPEPIQPKRTRSNEPTPFAGRTHKPHCALCEHEAIFRALQAGDGPLAEAAALLHVATSESWLRTALDGRRRQVDTSDL